MLSTYMLTLENLHCDACEISINRMLSDIVSKVQVSLQNKSVTVSLASDTDITPGIVSNILSKGGFIVTSVNNESVKSREGRFASIWKSRQISKSHRQVCTQCQLESKKHSLKHLLHLDQKSEDSTSLASEDVEVSIADAVETTEYRATFSISEMTCTACTSSISTTVHSEFPQVSSFEVSLLNKAGVAVFNDKQLASKIQELIRDLGYGCNLVELLPVSTSKSWKVTASIGGMTCASCSSAILQQVNPLPYVQDAAVDLMSNSATIYIDDPSKVDDLKEVIEDIGYEYELVKIVEDVHTQLQKKSRSINLEVEGMFCEHCPGNINNILLTYGDAVVIDDPISLKKPYIKFTYIPDPPNVTIRSILAKIRDVSPQFETKIIHPLSVEERSAQLTKIERRSLIMRLVLTIVIAIPTFIIGIVGMELLPSSNSIRQYLNEPMWVGSVSRSIWALFFLATAVYFFADDIFHRKSLTELRGLWKSGVSWKRRLFKFGSMNLLMSLGTSIAYFASIAELVLSARLPPDNNNGQNNSHPTTYFDSVVFLTMFLLIGRLLDSIAKSKTASSVSLLGNLRPDTVHLIQDVEISDSLPKFGESEVLSIDLVEVGDYIKVLPGMSCPVDGLIFEGQSLFDESALTGESRGVKKSIGEQIYAGTVNSGSSTVITKVTATDSGSLLSSIVEIVKQGQLHRAPIERFAEKITGIFVPVVTSLAVITWLIWLILGESGALPNRYLDINIGGWPVWSLEFSIAVFVVACPCGIGLAAPTALLVGSGLAAKYGILARGGGEAFQEGSRVDIVCFDKTGTLTEGGEPKITNAESTIDANEEDKKMLIGLARDLEMNSTHPLAIAVRNYAEEHNISSSGNTLSHTIEISGNGLQGNVNGEMLLNGTQVSQALIGNERLMSNSGVKIPQYMQETIELWKSEAKSVILLAVKTNDNEFKLVMAFAVADKIRDESKSVVEQLQKMGISCWMISGDNEVTARAVASQVSIPSENVIAGVLPQEKSDKVSWLQKTGNNSVKGKSSRAIVAMVGDGVNDAPSLAVADVGIAIGSGSDIALNSAKFILLRSNLNSILVLFDISRATFKRIKFNFGWALVYNMIGIPIAAGVIYPYNNSRLDPVWASLAMALSSLSVITSSFLLKFHKPIGAEHS